MSGIAYTLLESPLGDLLLTADGEGLRGLYMQEGPSAIAVDPGWRRDEAAFAEARTQLGEYFRGERTGFELPMAPRGTAWQQRVWRGVREIPHAQTLSYGQLAARLGTPGSARAVGAANGGNPLSILIPCHRLIGGDGSLTGYGGGVERKRSLLELEAAADAASGKIYRLLGADRGPYDSALPGALGGHRGNRVYGRLDCAGAARWIARGHYVSRRVFFSDEAMAIAAGFRPCGGCMRERHSEWKAGRFP